MFLHILFSSSQKMSPKPDYLKPKNLLKKESITGGSITGGVLLELIFSINLRFRDALG